MSFAPHRRAFPSLAVALVLAVARPAAVGAQGEPGPTAVVTAFHHVLLDTMREARTLGVRSRYDRLRPAMARAFDLPAMTRIAVGPPWTQLSPGQRDALVAGFSDWSVATYANRFNGYAGETFETLGEAPAPGGNDRLVRTRLNRTDGAAPVALTYLMRRAEAGWRIVDVYLTGTISEIASRRAEFTGLLREDGGADRLIAELRRRAVSELGG